MWPRNKVISNYNYSRLFSGSRLALIRSTKKICCSCFTIHFFFYLTHYISGLKKYQVTDFLNMYLQIKNMTKKSRNPKVRLWSMNNGKQRCNCIVSLCYYLSKLFVGDSASDFFQNKSKESCVKAILLTNLLEVLNLMVPGRNFFFFH